MAETTRHSEMVKRYGRLVAAGIVVAGHVAYLGAVSYTDRYLSTAVFLVEVGWLAGLVIGAIGFRGRGVQSVD